MTDLILTEEQTRLLATAQGRVRVKTPGGQELGKIDRPLTNEEIAALKARAKSAGPWFSSEQVQARTKALEVERERVGDFDHEYMTAFLDGLTESDPETYGPMR
jgi:hypothetical protein